MLPPKLILAPTDFSDPSHRSLDTAADLAAVFGAELLLVHVVPEIQDLPVDVPLLKEGEYDEALADSAEKHLADLAAVVGKKGVKVRTETGTGNDAAMELVRIAEHNNVDLIIIATHGMTGWRKIAFGSVAEKVVEEAECPVLVLRAKAVGDAAPEKDKASSPAASR